MTTKGEKITQNIITLEFIKQVDELIKGGKYDYKSLVELLRWNKTSMSAVINGFRNVPINKWELLKEVIKNENNQITVKKPLDEIIKEYHRDIIWLKASVKALTEKLAEIISKTSDRSVSGIITEIENDTEDIVKGRIGLENKK